MASTPSTQETSKLLQAHSWDLSASYDGRGQVTPHTVSSMPSSPRLQFDCQRVSLQNLCNVIGASYTLKEGRVEISLPMSTKRACVDRDLMALEQRLSAQLPQAERFDVSEGAPAHLIIHFADGSRWELIGTPASQAQRR